MTFDLFMELVGYTSSVVILISLLMTSVVKLRIFNAIGSFIFVVYALVTKSYPTALLNTCLVLVDLYFLWKILHKKADFSLVRGDTGESLTRHFLDYYAEDLEKVLPEADLSPETAPTAFFVYVGTNPVGLMLAREEGDTLHVSLDYSTPDYRDCSVGKFLYRELAQKGYRTLVCESVIPRHRDYLKSMGFIQDGKRFTMELKG